VEVFEHQAERKYKKNQLFRVIDEDGVFDMETESRFKAFQIKNNCLK